MTDVVALKTDFATPAATDLPPLAPPASPASPTQTSNPAGRPPALHEGLMGGQGPALRYRPTRLDHKKFSGEVTARFLVAGELVGPCPVLDVSEFGIGFLLRAAAVFPQGTKLEDMRVALDGVEIWSGEACVVRLVMGANVVTVGARFTTGLLDVALLQEGAEFRTDRLARRRLSEFAQATAKLPSSWRAQVGDLRVVLESLAEHLDAVDGDMRSRRQHYTPAEEAQLFADLVATWGPPYFDRLHALHIESTALDTNVLGLARSYARAQLVPALKRCPMHSQAIHKPLGYAGDFRFMELAYTDRLEGDSLFSRFMHYFSKRHAVTLSVQHRELRLREAIAKAIHAPGDGPVRILSLACGAAVEVQRFLSGIDDLPRPVELYLIDQDREALSHCHRELFRILTERHQSRLPVKVRVLHVAVQQLLHPRGIDEHAVLSELRHNVDLIYSAGLLDYLGRRVATRLVRRLYGMLRPGGRCLVGNMKIVPENHWLMEFILDWVLIYRTPESMRALAAQLRPTPDEISIVEDETGYCMFLDVARPTS